MKLHQSEERVKLFHSGNFFSKETEGTYSISVRRHIETISARQSGVISARRKRETILAVVAQIASSTNGH